MGDKGPAGSTRGCSRKTKDGKTTWCLFCSWSKESSNDEKGLEVIRNIPHCAVAMNQFPVVRAESGSTFNENDGVDTIWKTAMESYGSILDGRAEGRERHRRIDHSDRFLTGFEGFLPGEFMDEEVMVEEATKGMFHKDVELVEDLVFNHGCSVRNVDDMLMFEEGRARDIILPGRTFSPGSACPSFLHPALVFFDSLGTVSKYLDILEEEEKYNEMISVYRRLRWNLNNNVGSMRKLLQDSPVQRKLWLKIERRIIDLMGYLIS